MACVITIPGTGKPLIIVGCQSRQCDDKESRRAAKAGLQAELSRQWLDWGSAGLPLHYSYSHLADQTWAAVTEQPCLIGIDAASDSEFANAYPLRKVFHAGEIATERPARIWSAKEAVAKALGCGFDGINPLDISIVGDAASTSSGPGMLFSAIVGVAKTAVSAVNSVKLNVWSQQQADGIWVSLAYGTWVAGETLAENNASKKGNSSRSWNY